jgi:signal transduction histidine kinase/DNA-binding response OmpR family regulator
LKPHIYPQPEISILYVEDDSIIRSLLSTIILKKFPDIELLTAENGRNGLEVYAERKPDIIITDLRMPHMDGIQMASEIKAINPETIIIIVTAHNDTHYLLEAIEIGINYYVMKPVEQQKLISVIDKSIAGINLLWQVRAQEAEIQKLASFTQICPNPVIETDLAGRITYYNEAARKTLREISQGEEISRFLPGDLKEMLQLFQGKKAIRCNREVRINSACFEENIFFAQQFETVRIYATDITERKKMQDELLKAQKLESLGVLAGGIAHGFNNILTAILGNLSLAKMKLNASHNIAKCLDECEKAVVQATELTQQLLTFSIGGEPVKKLIPPASLIRNAAAFVLQSTNVRSIIELADDLWCVEADGGQLNQALHNLLINATQAMPGGGEVSIRAVNETLDRDNPHQLSPGDYLRITIEDHGCGIPRENLARIFDPYFTTKPQGTGLGLSAVYSIVKKHGGTTEICSAVGEGSCFTIHLPALPGRQTEETVEKGADLAESGRVLIMDDEELIRDIATNILEFNGYEVESCADGREAIKRFKAAWERNVPFNVVILDLTVPGGMGGKEATTHLRRIDPDVLLIVSSGYSNDPVIANYQEYGFCGVLHKPFDAATLARELERLVSQKR